MGYSPWERKELATTDHIHTHLYRKQTLKILFQGTSTLVFKSVLVQQIKSLLHLKILHNNALPSLLATSALDILVTAQSLWQK